MRICSIVIVAAALLPVGLGLAARAESLHSLRAAEEVFYKAGLPFQIEWRPNRYLRPGSIGPGSSDPNAVVPKALLPHLTGWAEGVNTAKFTFWTVFVFDGTSAAVAYARRTVQPSKAWVVLRANNVVYVGTRFRSASRAMAHLRQQ